MRPGGARVRPLMSSISNHKPPGALLLVELRTHTFLREKSLSTRVFVSLLIYFLSIFFLSLVITAVYMQKVNKY
jgi:hypothetical protein